MVQPRRQPDGAAPMTLEEAYRKLNLLGSIEYLSDGTVNLATSPNQVQTSLTRRKEVMSVIIAWLSSNPSWTCVADIGELEFETFMERLYTLPLWRRRARGMLSSQSVRV